MAYGLFLVICFVLSTSSLLLLHLLRPKRSRPRRPPPGPPGWPLIGNLFDLGSMPHRTLAGLREKYGPVIWLRLGAVNTMVILSAKASAEFFKNHDLAFAERTVTDIMKVHDYDKGSVALAPYGSYWRVLRRLVTVDMLVSKRLNESAHIRRKCVDNMLLWIEEAASKSPSGNGIHVARFVFHMSFNLLGNLLLSRDMFDPNSKVGSEFFEAMMGMMEWTGHANIADIFPFLRWLDPQGLKRKMKRDLGKAMEIATKYVKERMEEEEKEGVKKRDFLSVLLEFEGNGKDEPAKFSEHEVNIFILEIFLAGSETTSSTIEWALTELLLNPICMMKAKTELHQVIGSHGKMQEADIENLPYLQAVIKETLRLHPPIPFLVPRRAMKDTNFMGYDVPENTQVFVNAWAIGRDPDVWDDPMFFNPDRFIRSKVDYKGQHYEYIPFGAGRRMCAGVPLAYRVLHLLLGSLLHQFDWELDSRIDPKLMDMSDRLGVTVKRNEPLMAVPKKCK